MADATLVTTTFVAPTANVWPATNRAIYVPQSFPTDCTIYSISFAANNGSNNYDLGLYDGNLNKIASSGSTAMSAAGVKTLTFSDYRVYAGNIIYGALVLSGTAGSVLNMQLTVAIPSQTFGWAQEALGSTALPSSMTPAVPASTYVPIFAFGVR